MIGASKNFLTINTYPDGRPAECFVTLSGESGSETVAWANACMQAVSIALQYQAPMLAFANHWVGVHSDMCGVTGEGEAGIPSASSRLDYIGKLIRREYPVGTPSLAPSAETVPDA